MKPSTLKPKLTERYVPAPTIHTPQLPKDVEQIRQRAQEIYVARGGIMGMTLNDWLKAELELKQQLGAQTNQINRQP